MSTDRKAQRILVVDDEADNRELFGLILDWEGYSVATAESGEGALDSIGEQVPDLVLLDLMMPGMNGYEVAEMIKANPLSVHVPVMLVSAVSDRDARTRALGAGADDFLAKPFARAELVSRVRTLLRAPKTTAQTG